MADVEVLAADERHAAVLRRLLQLYLYDFSKLDGRDVDESGEFAYRHLGLYWTEPKRRPFLLHLDGCWAGFALLRLGQPHQIAEFFVLPKYRRRRIGESAAHQLFQTFAGDWAVSQLRSNPAATDFWRSAIPVAFEETADDLRLEQHFTINPQPPPSGP